MWSLEWKKSGIIRSGHCGDIEQLLEEATGVYILTPMALIERTSESSYQLLQRVLTLAFADPQNESYTVSFSMKYIDYV